jgi:hypothetical protein
MKTLGFLFLLIIITLQTTRAQEGEKLLNSFLIFQNNNSIELNWSLKKGSSCNDIYIERSTDGIQFERIGVIAGVCGSPDFVVPYSYTDTTPIINKTNYYRIELGFQGYSQTYSLPHIDYHINAYLLYPNPVQTQAKLRFFNPNLIEHQIQIFNLQGKLEYQSEFIRVDEFLLELEEYANGIYIFVIRNEEMIRIKGKIIVQ